MSDFRAPPCHANRRQLTEARDSRGHVSLRCDVASRRTTPTTSVQVGVVWSMGRRLQRGWRIYDRDGIFWATYPFKGDTKRESTRTRDPVMAEVFLAQRRREIEGAGLTDDFDGQPKDYGADGTVRAVWGPNVDP